MKFSIKRKYYCIDCGRVSEKQQKCCNRRMLAYDECSVGLLNLIFNP